MDETVIERVQGQGQMVEQRDDMTVVGAGTSPSHLGMLHRHLPTLGLMPYICIADNSKDLFCDL